MMLIDSDVLIWAQRGLTSAKARLADLSDWRISAVTYMEVMQGCRNKEELRHFKRTLDTAETEIVALTKPMSDMACELIDAFALSHHLQLADALTAATAITQNLTLLTANVKHLKPITKLKFDPFILS